jgi:hypothetical protein
MEVCGQLHDGVALSPRKEPPIPTEQEAGWVPEPAWNLWKRKTCCPYQDSNLNSWAIQPAAIPTELSQLLIMNLVFFSSLRAQFISHILPKH